MDIYPVLVCRTGALTPGGRHFVRYWASLGAPVGRGLGPVLCDRTFFQGFPEYE
jgi:hypothetical protein